MTITEYVEKVAGIELRPYQKKILELMEQHKDDELTWVPSLGRFVFIPKEKKGEDKMINANDLYYDDSEFRYLQSIGIIEGGELTMTKREAAIVSVYTGVLIGDFSDFYAYAVEIMGRPIFTHEFPYIADELKEKSKKDFMSIQITEEPPEWLYHTPFEDRSCVDFDTVEKALGFRLFGWQKDYIISDCAYTYASRRTGKTTAHILRHLLNVNKEPIDFSRPAQSKRMDIIRQDCRDIWEKLRDAGIEMRPVFWSNEDKKNYKKAALLD